jgi:hypothetical protein
MREEQYNELVFDYYNMYSRIMNNRIIEGDYSTVQSSTNLCCEIELPKEKKSEKPKFKQTKK